MINEKSCGVILSREEKGERYFLLLHYSGGHWDFPKGHVEKGESEEETLRRELREETGIDEIRVSEGFREVIDYVYRRGEQLIHKDVVFFSATTSLREVILSHEHIGYDWLDYRDALERLTYDNAKNVLKKVHIFFSAKAWR